MQSKYLFNDEIIINQMRNAAVVLTNYRIRYSRKGLSTAHTLSILLEKISSIEVHYKSYPLMLVLGMLLALGSTLISGPNKDLSILGYGIGGLLILFFFITQKHVITVESDGGAKMNFRTKAMRPDAILNFVNQIEEAKKNRQDASSI